MPNYTTNLNLLKKNPGTDGSDYFDIQTMLNDNWDKIDAGVKAVDDKVTTHEAEDATTAQKGHMQLATNAEVTTGTDATKAVTPAGAKVELDKRINHSLATAANDFLVASGVGMFVKKTLAEVKTILGLGSAAYTASTDYAVSAKGVTNGDTHDHSGGDGAQINHTTLSNIGTNTHAQIDTHISATAPHSGHVAHSLATAANDFLVASGAGAWAKQTLAQVKATLGLGSAAYTASTDYATAAQGTLATNAIPKGTVTTANDFIVATGNAAVARKSLADTRNLLAAPIVAVSATKTLSLTDADTMQNCTNTSAITITIPPNSSVAFSIGTEIAIVRQGAGDVLIAPGSGVTLSSKDSKRKINGQYASCALKKIATDTWMLVGSLAT